MHSGRLVPNFQMWWLSCSRLHLERSKNKLRRKLVPLVSKSSAEILLEITHFMFQHGVLALGILSNNGNVDIFVVSRHSGERSALQHIHEQVQFIPQGHIPRNGVGGFAFGFDIACISEQKTNILISIRMKINQDTMILRTLDSNTIPFDRRNGILQVIVSLAGWIDVDNFKVDRYTDASENVSNVLHQLWSNAAAGQHRNGMTSTELGHRDAMLEQKKWSTIDWHCDSHVLFY